MFPYKAGRTKLLGRLFGAAVRAWQAGLARRPLLAIALALASSLCWGVADFAGGLTSRRLPAAVVLLGQQVAGGLICVALVVATAEALPVVADGLAVAARAAPRAASPSSRSTARSRSGR